jgi:hypothetical protein
VVVVDAVLWHGAPARLLDAPRGTDDGTSLLARAALRRLITSDRLAAEQEPSTRDEYLRAAASDHDRVLGLLGPRVS